MTAAATSDALGKYLDTISRMQMLANEVRNSESTEYYAELFPRLASIESAAARAQVELVNLMRERGASWAAVGNLFGITRQAAQQRFGR